MVLRRRAAMQPPLAMRERRAASGALGGRIESVVMRVVRITSLGDHKNAVNQIIKAIEHEPSQYHFEPKKRYGDTTSSGTIDF